MSKLEFHPKKTTFDLVNARALAQTSTLAYKSDEQIVKTLKG